MAETRVIKRYANRKLYDTQRSRYVTLEQIADMIRGGEDVKIIDNNTKEDLTKVTLAQIMFEEEKKQKSFLPLNAMRNIIQSGGERIEELVSQAQRRVSGVFTRKQAGDAAAAGGEMAEPAVEADPAEAALASELKPVVEPKEGARALKEFREWIESYQRAIDDWQKRVDERVRHVVEGISPFASLQKEVAGLVSRVAELEKKLEHLARRGGDGA